MCSGLHASKPEYGKEYSRLAQKVNKKITSETTIADRQLKAPLHTGSGAQLSYSYGSVDSRRQISENKAYYLSVGSAFGVISLSR